MNVGFTDRALRNWETLLMGLKMYCTTQEEFTAMETIMYKRHQDYYEMLKKDKMEHYDGTLSNFTEEIIS